MSVNRVLSLVSIISLLTVSASAEAVRMKKSETKKTPIETAEAKVDADKSSIKWVGKKKLINSEHHGQIKIKEGMLKFQGDQLMGGQVVVDMTTITNKDPDGESHEKLVGHLKSDDFFAVDKFNTATFTIKEAKKVEGNKYEVKGDLMIKGQTNEEKLTVTVKEQKDGLWQGQGEMTFDRTKYNIRYGSDNFFDNLGDKVISNDVKLTLMIVAKEA